MLPQGHSTLVASLCKVTLEVVVQELLLYQSEPEL